MKIMHKLFVFYILPFFTIISVMVFLSNYQDRSVLEERIKESAELELNMHADKIDLFFRKHVELLEMLSHTQTVQSGNIRSILNYFKAEEKRLSGDIEGLYFNDLKGNAYSVSGKIFNVSDRYYFPAISSGKTVITKMLISRVTSKPVILILVPVFNKDGVQTGAVGGTVPVTSLTKFIKRDDTENSFAAIIDKENNIVSDFGFSVEKRYFDSILNFLKNSKKGNCKITISDTHFHAYSKVIKNMNWSILLVYKDSLFYSAVHRKHLMFFLMFFSTALVSLFFVFGIKKNIITPINNLIAILKKFGDGNMKIRSEIHGEDEINDLSLSFNNMADQLSEAEKELVKSEERIRSLIEQSPLSIQILDSAGYIISANKAWEDLWGVPLKEVKKHGYNLLKDEQTGNLGIADYINKAFSGESTHFPDTEYDASITSAIGKKKWVSGNIYPVKDEAGNVDTVVLIQSDITEQKNAETALKKSKEQYQALYNNIPVGLFRSTFEGDLLSCNPAFLKMFEISETEKYRTVDYYTNIEDREYLLEELVKKGRVSNFEVPAKTGKGDDIYVVINAVGVFEDDRLKYIDGTMENVTQRKLVEKKKSELEKRMFEAQKLEAIGTLSGGIAHDFNNILSGILGFTELAMRDVKDMPKTKSKLENVLSASERAAELVKQILLFSRRQKVEFKAVDPVEITGEVLKLIKATLSKQIELKVSLDSKSMIFADSINIHQVIMNLCTNASHAMKESEEGFLSIHTKDVELHDQDVALYPNISPGNFVEISVEDTGYGIPKDIQQKIFDPFFTTKEKGEGTGLGLAAVHGIVAELGGFITLYSQVGQGTSVHLFIPSIVTEDGRKELETIAPEGGCERILLVDDEKMQVELAHQLLSSHGYSVTSFTSSLDALDFFNKNPDEIDLLITDITMPKMTGDILVRKIREIRPDIPVIMCTGFSEKIDEEKAAHLGVSAFLYKPVPTVSFLVNIRSVLNRH